MNNEFKWDDTLVLEFIKGAIKVQNSLPNEVDLNNGLMHFKKSKQPTVKEVLFITEDGFNVTEPSTWIYAAELNTEGKWCGWALNAISKSDPNSARNIKYFLIKSNRDWYVAQNTPKKPVFTCNLIDYFEGDEYFNVMLDFTIIPMKALYSNIINYTSENVFQTRQLAEDYVFFKQACSNLI